MDTVEKLRDQVSKLEAELQHLLTVKAEKLVNRALLLDHTQLSYQSKDNQERYCLYGRKTVLDLLINALSKL
jgi:multidrug efflux pump subunit AcrA (membrane-fusion protein)